MHVLNDPRPWWGTLRGAPLSMAELIQRGTLSAEAAAVLGWTLRRGASAFVAAGPSGAGKSTIATALLEYLPEAARAYVTSGVWDRLEVDPTAGTVDGPIYLLINELSWHMPLYLSGPAAQQAFRLLASGVRMLGTLHARSAAEAVRVMCAEAEISRATLVAPFVLVVLQAGWRGQRIERRVTEIGWLPPDGDLARLAGLDGERLRIEPDGLAALAAWAKLPLADLRAELDVLQSDVVLGQ